MNANTQKYLQKSSDCLSDATYLLEDHRLEAACNRAYYAIFDSIQALLINENIVVKTHQGTHSKFRELFIKTGILPTSLSETLAEIFNLRQGGDYDNDFEIIEPDAKAIIQEAYNFVHTIVNFLEKVETPTPT